MKIQHKFPFFLHKFLQKIKKTQKFHLILEKCWSKRHPVWLQRYKYSCPWFHNSSDTSIFFLRQKHASKLASRSCKFVSASSSPPRPVCKLLGLCCSSLVLNSLEKNKKSSQELWWNLSVCHSQKSGLKWKNLLSLASHSWYL